MSTLGVISFLSEFSQLKVTSFPQDTLPIIAPLWANFDFRNSGSIYYRVAYDTATLNEAARMVTETNSDYSTFQPKQAVIVTWVKSRLHTDPCSTVRISYND